MTVSGVRAPSCVIAVLGALAVALSLLALAPAAADEHEPIDRPDDGAPATVPVDRFAGDNRADTAGLIADHDFDGSADTVLMGRWDDFPDVLAANYLAAQVEAPILLTHTTHLTSDTAEWLDTLGAEHAIILGGTAAISAAAEDEITDQGITTERIGGADRYDTAALLATGDGDDHDRVVGQYNGQNAAVVATGEVFVDALAAGGMAFDQDFPVLLTRQDQLEEATADALEALDIEFVFIPGGTQAVAQEVEDAIAAMDIDVHRFAGARRTETATLIADFTIEQFGFTPDHVNLGRGDLFPDVLTMGPHAGGENSPLLVTWTPDQLDVTDAADDERRHTEIWLREHACLILHLHLAGGTAAVSDPVARQAQDAAEDCPTNIVFEADPAFDTFAVNPTDADHAYTFDVLDHDQVTVVLADPEDVHVEDGRVRFDVTEVDGELFADLEAAANVQITAIDGAAQTAGTVEATVAVDGDVEVTIAPIDTGEVADIVPVVFVGDAQGRLVVDADGLPEVDFGIGGRKLFADVDAIDVQPAVDLNQFDTEHEVTAELVTADDPAVVVPLAGDTIDVTVIDVTAQAPDFAAQCEAYAQNPDDIPDNTVVLTGDAQVGADGSAEFAYTGPAGNDDDVIVHCILATWQGEDDFADQDAVGFALKHWIDLAEVDALAVTDEDVSADAEPFAYRVDVGFDVRDADGVLWVENGQVFDVTDPDGAEALYLDEGERYVNATVTVYYLLDADTAPDGAGWYSITVGYDADGQVETIGEFTVAG